VLGRACPGWGQTCPRNASEIRHGDRISPVRDFVAKELGEIRHVQAGGQTCLARVTETRLLSRIRLRGRTCLTWGSDMSDQSLWNPTRRPDMSGLTGVFGGRIDF
jgi:hypothetical protein